MKLNGLAKLYDQFTPEERFRLVVQALARGDRAEADRLGRACQTKTYTMSDARYADRLDASEALTLGVLLELAPKLAKLRVVGALREFGEYLESLRACYAL